MVSVVEIMLFMFRYSYQIGHELPDGTVVWGKSSTFRASPFPGQDSLQRVVVFGDMGLVGILTKLLQIYLFSFSDSTTVSTCR